MTLEKLKSLCSFYVGKDVEIEWENEDWDWPTFHVVAVDLDHEAVKLKGIDSKWGKHEGDTDIYAIAEIKTIRRYDP
jgi:hypothetical protein